MRAFKAAAPDLVVITDVCLCEYTDHGHCGLIDDGEVDNDASHRPASPAPPSPTRAPAPTWSRRRDMMDGRVAAVRETLDDAGFEQTPIMAYSAKYASAFYGPFRDAADSAPQFGDRRGYQMDPPNAREALREIEADLERGRRHRDGEARARLPRRASPRPARAFDAPLAAYNVSGEYAMIKAAAANGWIDERRATLEALTAIKRAGADIIITYHAKDAARWLAE